MGRAGRPKSGAAIASADGSRGSSAAGTSSTVAAPLADKCKTDNQRAVYNIVCELSANGQGPVSLGDIISRGKEALGEEGEVMIAIGGMTEGLGWGDRGADRTRGPILKIDDKNAVRAKISPVSQDYYEKHNYLSESSPWGYGGMARLTRDRDRDALASAGSEAEREVLQELIERTPFDPVMSGEYKNADDIRLALRERFSRAEVHEAMLSLHDKTVIRLDETDGARVRLSTSTESMGENSRFGREQSYLKEFGQEELEARLGEIEKSNERAYSLAQGSGEEAVLSYLHRKNPKREDDQMSYENLAEDMEPLMSQEELSGVLQSMENKGIVEQIDNGASGKSFALSAKLLS